MCRCLRHAPWAGRAAPSRGRSAGIAASEPDPGVRRRPPPLLRDASVPHTHQGIRMVVIDSSRAVVRCHRAALRSGPAHASCKCLFRADPQALGVFTKTFPWRGSAWTCSTFSRLRRDEPVPLPMPFHRYDGPFRRPSPPSLRVILHREGRLPSATAAGDLNYTGSAWTGTQVRPHRPPG